MPYRAILLMFAAPVIIAANRTPVPAVESKPHPRRIQGLNDDVLCATFPVWDDDG